MPLKIPCPKCKHRLSITEDAVGKRVKCPSCQEAFIVRPPEGMQASEKSEAAKVGPIADEPDKKYWLLLMPQVKFGPYSAEQLRPAILLGAVRPNTPVHVTGKSGWSLLSKLGEFRRECEEVAKRDISTTRERQAGDISFAPRGSEPTGAATLSSPSSSSVPKSRVCPICRHVLPTDLAFVQGCRCPACQSLLGWIESSEGWAIKCLENSGALAWENKAAESDLAASAPDVHQYSKARLQPMKGPIAFLQMLNGSSPGRLYSLAGERAVLGRHPDCDIVLEDDAVSRRHADITVVRGEYFVEDLGSRHGTFVNGQPACGRHRLRNDDQVKICNLLFAFRRREPTATTSIDSDEAGDRSLLAASRAQSPSDNDLTGPGRQLKWDRGWLRSGAMIALALLVIGIYHHGLLAALCGSASLLMGFLWLLRLVESEHSIPHKLLRGVGTSFALMWVSLWLTGIVPLLPAPGRPPLPVESLNLATVTLHGLWSEKDLAFDDQGSWSGTAFVIGKTENKLLLLTNAHCLGLNALAEADVDGGIEVLQYGLRVEFPSGEARAVIRMAEAANGLDLAELEVAAEGLTEGRDYVVVPDGSATGAEVGDTVIAVGTPLGVLPGTHTYGRISAFRQLGPDGTHCHVIQHDAAINHGNSGGPLFVEKNSKAHWVGVNTWKPDDGGIQGIYLSIAASEAMAATYVWGGADVPGAVALLRKLHNVQAVDASAQAP